MWNKKEIIKTAVFKQLHRLGPESVTLFCTLFASPLLVAMGSSFRSLGCEGVWLVGTFTRTNLYQSWLPVLVFYQPEPGARDSGLCWGRQDPGKQPSREGWSGTNYLIRNSSGALQVLFLGVSCSLTDLLPCSGIFAKFWFLFDVVPHLLVFINYNLTTAISKPNP